ncbi:MAG: VOC family protein [Marmoricola sp.]
MIPTLGGVHHLKLPVSDIARSVDWYGSRLGYQVVLEFHDDGVCTGVCMQHPDGGPDLALHLAPERAAVAAGFDYFAIGVPGRRTLLALADHLTDLGEDHAGVHFATLGWILPLLHDPDGHEVRFYSNEEHSPLELGTVRVVEDVMAAARQGELDWLVAQGLEPVPDGSLIGLR